MKRTRQHYSLVVHRDNQRQLQCLPISADYDVALNFIRCLLNDNTITLIELLYNNEVIRTIIPDKGVKK